MAVRQMIIHNLFRSSNVKTCNLYCQNYLQCIFTSKNKNIRLMISVLIVYTLKLNYADCGIIEHPKKSKLRTSEHKPWSAHVIIPALGHLLEPNSCFSLLISHCMLMGYFSFKFNFNRPCSLLARAKIIFFFFGVGGR